MLSLLKLKKMKKSIIIFLVLIISLSFVPNLKFIGVFYLYSMVSIIDDLSNFTDNSIILGKNIKKVKRIFINSNRHYHYIIN